MGLNIGCAACLFSYNRLRLGHLAIHTRTLLHKWFEPSSCFEMERMRRVGAYISEGVELREQTDVPMLVGVDVESHSDGTNSRN